MLLRKLMVFMLLTIFFTVGIACSSDSKSISLSPKSIDFGGIYIGDDSTSEILIKNKYGKDVVITALNLSGSSDFSLSSSLALPYSLLKDSEVKIELNFAPTSSGLFEGALTLIHSESTKPVMFDFSGTGIPVARIKLSETSFDFDKKLINKTHTHDLEIENIGTSDLSISSLGFSGVGASVYSVTSAPINIQPGNKKTVTITFAPIVLGNYSADLSIVHNGVNENSPIVYSVQGEGIDLDPRITLSQSNPWDFGSVPTSIDSIQICEIENTGIDPLTVSSISLLTGTEFTIDKFEDSNGNIVNLPQIIAVGSKIFMYIKFSPSSITTYNDTMTIVHDGTNETTPWDIALSGSGKTATNANFSYTGTIVSWTVPAGVTTVRIETWGAQGGMGGGAGGKGARMRGDFSVTPGETIKILVGEQGGGNPPNCLGGGGGGTYVWKDGASDPMIVAGAGGGGAYGTGGTPGVDAVITNDGVDGAGTWAVGGKGTNGNGGVPTNYPQRMGGGGAGWKSDGCQGSNSASGTDAGGGKCPSNGGAGGLMGGTNSSNGDGGFGGGGGAQGRNGASAAGAGGGYSGGGPGAEDPSGIGYTTAAGGAGGSYNDGSNQDNQAAVNTGNGRIVITY